METSNEETKPVFDILNSFSTDLGFEFYPFLIGWYNNVVQDKFRLDYLDDALGICIITTPSFFEKCFIPFASKGNLELSKDPIDQCISSKFAEIKTALSDYNIDVIHDFEIHEQFRRPKVLVQSAGHVSGSVYYYQQCHVENQPWGEKKIYGVSIHPKYGGWFGFRGTFIFKDLSAPSLKQVEPVDMLSNEDKITLLNNFNYNWKDWSFRDILPVEEKYSELQKRYFETKPADRGELLKEIQEM